MPRLVPMCVSKYEICRQVVFCCFSWSDYHTTGRIIKDNGFRSGGRNGGLPDNREELEVVSTRGATTYGITGNQSVLFGHSR